MKIIFLSLLFFPFISFAQTDTTKLSLINHWQLLSVKDLKTGQVADYQDFKNYLGTKRMLYVIFEVASMRFGLDVNDCGWHYRLLSENKIIIGENKPNPTCTRACCDQLDFKYKLVTEYQIQGKTLSLISPQEIFTFTWIEDVDKFYKELREDE